MIDESLKHVKSVFSDLRKISPPEQCENHDHNDHEEKNKGKGLFKGLAGALNEKNN